LAILRGPLVAMVTGNLGLVQSTFVPSLISIEAVFISFIAILTCNGRLFNENSHFEIMG
jgi:hypothetical protein